MKKNIIAISLATITSLSFINVQAQTTEVAKIAGKSFLGDLKSQVVNQVKTEVQNQAMQQLGMNGTNNSTEIAPANPSILQNTNSNNGMLGTVLNSVGGIGGLVGMATAMGGKNTTGNNPTTGLMTDGLKQMVKDNVKTVAKDVTTQVTQEAVKGAMDNSMIQGVVGMAATQMIGGAVNNNTNTTNTPANQLNTKGMMGQILGAATAMAPAILGPKINAGNNSNTSNNTVSAITNVLNQAGTVGKAVTTMGGAAIATTNVLNQQQAQNQQNQTLSSTISQGIINQSKKLMAKVSKSKTKAKPVTTDTVKANK